MRPNEKIVTMLHNKLHSLLNEHQRLQVAFDDMHESHTLLTGLLYNHILEAKNLRELKRYIKSLSIERAEKRGYVVDNDGKAILEEET